VLLESGERVELNATTIEKDYSARLLESPDLTEVSTALGSVPMDWLYVPPFLAPAASATRPGAQPGAGADGIGDMGAEPAVDAVGRYRRMVIVAPPGMGKSTFLGYLTRMMAEGRLADSFPVFIPLQTYAHATEGDAKDVLTKAKVSKWTVQAVM
jgi:hypothetical protein